jgi:hypothetical protein
MPRDSSPRAEERLPDLVAPEDLVDYLNDFAA